MKRDLGKNRNCRCSKDVGIVHAVRAAVFEYMSKET